MKNISVPAEVGATIAFETDRQYHPTKPQIVECKVIEVDLDRAIVVVYFYDRVRMIAGILNILKFDEDDITAQDVLDSYDAGGYYYLTSQQIVEHFGSV